MPKSNTTATKTTKSAKSAAVIPYTKRIRLTKYQELQICNQNRAQPGSTYNELAEWARREFKLPKRPTKPVIGRVLKSEAMLLRLTPESLQQKKAHAPHQLLLDQCVIEFLAFCELSNISLFGELIMAQAKKLAVLLAIPASKRPCFGWSWLRHLEARYSIRWRRSYGESSSVNEDVAAAKLHELRQLSRQYRRRDIYNMDETGFFYNNVPRGSICINKAPSLKQDKARITLAVYANADGSDKLPLLFVGKAATPRWWNQRPDGLQYNATKKAWMTIIAFHKWLLALDERMRREQRHVLLLVDNASSHSDEGLQLTNVRLERLPPNTTSRYQPMDQGIIYCVKRDVLRQKMNYALEQIDSEEEKPYKVGMLRGIVWCIDAWDRLSAMTIANCWRHAGLLDKSAMNYILD